MRNAAIAAILVIVMLPNAASSQKPKAPAGELPAGYKPGLGELMLLTQARHLKLWLAGNSSNWELADYQIDELKEGLEDAGKLIPVYKKMPIGEMIEATMTSPIEAAEAAIKLRDEKPSKKRLMDSPTPAMPVIRHPAVRLSSSSDRTATRFQTSVFSAGREIQALCVWIRKRSK